MRAISRRVAALVTAVALSSGPAGSVDYGGLSPEEFSADYLRASELVEAGQFDEALGVLRDLVDARPSDADALNLLGYSLRKLGYPERAEHFYLRALAIAPEHPGANQYLGEFYVELGNIPGARERLAVLDATCAKPCAGRDALAAAVTAAGW